MSGALPVPIPSPTLCPLIRRRDFAHSKKLLMDHRKPDRGAPFQFTLRLEVVLSFSRSSI
jgi:hypothetical protein